MDEVGAWFEREGAPRVSSFDRVGAVVEYATRTTSVGEGCGLLGGAEMIDVLDEADFRRDVQAALGVLAERPGHVRGQVGRNVDDPDLWLLTTTWENVGSYRRALSSYDVKVTAVPLLSRAIDEPSAFEEVGEEDAVTNRQVPRELG